MTFASDSSCEINDPITDETGAHAGGVAISQLGPGPDGLVAGGGTGVWDLSVSGALKLSGQQGFSGGITIKGGATLDLSDVTGMISNDVTVYSNASLTLQPSIASSIQLGHLTLYPNSTLELNGYSSLSIQDMRCTNDGKLILKLSQLGFTPNEAVCVLTSKKPLPSKLTIAASHGFNAVVSGNTVNVTMLC